MTLDHYLASYAKIDAKWIKDLKVRLEIVKLLEENISEKVLDINLYNDFWIWHQKQNKTNGIVSN